MTDSSVTYFPVGNGDTSLIRLSDDTDILIDCNVRNNSGDEDESCYDVHNHLLSVVKEDDADTPFVDAFLLTHGDQDHARGCQNVLYLGDPANYAERHRKDGLIRIDEFWFTPRIFSEDEAELCEDAAVLRDEAKRRMKLYQDADPRRYLPGNRLRIIGYSDSEELEGLDDIITVPGSTISAINMGAKSDFSFFIHAPFKKDTDSEDCARNDTSVVVQARFDVDGQSNACLLMFGGDAGCAIWGDILDKSRDETLGWDLFLAPHHCSWTFFSEQPYSENPEPDEKVMKVLRKRRAGARVIASCKPIKDDDNNPPHYGARSIYVGEVGEERFHVTCEEPDEANPQPIVFVMSKNGPVRDDSGSKSREIASSASIGRAVGSPRTYGR